MITLLQYLHLNPLHVINISFDDYYFYPDTLVNTKTKQIIRNLKLNPLLPLSRQIKHPIIIPPNPNKNLTTLTIKINNTILYQEHIYPRTPEKYETVAIISNQPDLPIIIKEILSPHHYNIIHKD
jgi:hypothetical protein